MNHGGMPGLEFASVRTGTRGRLGATAAERGVVVVRRVVTGGGRGGRGVAVVSAGLRGAALMRTGLARWGVRVLWGLALTWVGGSYAQPARPPAGGDLLVDLWAPGAVPGLDVLGLASSAVPPHLLPVIGLTGGLVGEPLVLSAGSGAVALVETRWQADLTVGVGLWDRLGVSLQLPLIFEQSAPRGALTEGKLTERGVGDLRLALRGLLFAGEGLGLALGLDLHAPTGSARAWTTADGFRVTPTLIADWYATSGLGLVLNLGWRFAPERRVHDLVADDAFMWGVGLVMPTPAPRLDARATVSGAVSTARGVDPQTGMPLDDDRLDPIEGVFAVGFGFGAQQPSARVARWPVRVELGGGAGLSRGLGAPQWRAFLAVSWSPGEGGAN